MISEHLIKKAQLDIPLTAAPLPTRVYGEAFGGPIHGDTSSIPTKDVSKQVLSGQIHHGNIMPSSIVLPLGSRPIQDFLGNTIGYDWSNLATQEKPTLTASPTRPGGYSRKGGSAKTSTEDSPNVIDPYPRYKYRSYSGPATTYDKLFPTSDLAEGNLVRYDKNSSMGNLSAGYQRRPGDIATPGVLLDNGRSDVPVFDLSYQLADRATTIPVSYKLPNPTGNWGTTEKDDGSGFRMPANDPTTHQGVMQSGIIGTFNGNGSRDWEIDMLGKPVTTLDNLFNAELYDPNDTSPLGRTATTALLLKQDIGKRRLESLNSIPNTGWGVLDRKVLNKFHPLALPITLGNSAGNMSTRFLGNGYTGINKNDVSTASSDARNRHYAFNGLVGLKHEDVEGGYYSPRSHVINLPKTTYDGYKASTPHTLEEYMDTVNDLLSNDLPMNHFYGKHNSSALSTLLHEGVHALDQAIDQLPYSDTHLRLISAITGKGGEEALESIKQKLVPLHHSHDSNDYIKKMWDPKRRAELEDTSLPAFVLYGDDTYDKVDELLANNPQARELWRLMKAQSDAANQPGVMASALGSGVEEINGPESVGYAQSHLYEMLRAMHQYKTGLTRELLANKNLTPLQIVEKVLNPDYALNRFMLIAPPILEDGGLPTYSIPAEMATPATEKELSRAIHGLHKAWYGPTGPLRDRAIRKHDLFNNGHVQLWLTPEQQMRILRHIWSQVRNNRNTQLYYA